MSCSAGHRAIATGWRCPKARCDHDPALLGAGTVARDPRRVPMSLDIEVLDGPGPLPLPDDATIAAGFRRVATYVRTRTLDQKRPGTANANRVASREPNKFPKPVKPGDHALAAADAAYSMAPFVLGPDEALVITGRWPECRCANVTLWNRHLQTFDYVHRAVAQPLPDEARRRRPFPHRHRAS